MTPAQWRVQDIGDDLLGRDTRDTQYVDAEVAQDVLDYMNADPGIVSGSLYWLSEGQPAVWVNRAPVH